jgi:hypothetical protein
MARLRKAVVLRGATMAGLLASMPANASESSQVKFLRKNQEIESEARTGHQRVKGNAAMEHSLEDIWEQAEESAQVELEAQRLLQASGDFSMPTRRPTFQPTPRPTPAPTQPTSPGDCLEGTTKEDYIRDLLLPFTQANVLDDPTTPQGKAFDFLVSQDSYLDDPCTVSTIEQRYGLVTVYYATEGADWLDRAGWLGPQSECTWLGVECPLGEETATKLIIGEYLGVHVFY